MFSTKNWVHFGLVVAALGVFIPRTSAQTISCSSDDGKRHYCSANAQGRVRLVQQRSESACREGYSWGSDSRGIWVDHGCRADFTIEAERGYGDRDRDRDRDNDGYRGDNQGSDQNGVISCSSDDGGRHYCPANVQGRVQLVKQRSDSPCQEGYGWGSDGRGIWVDHGCRADFAVTPYPGGGSDQGGVISCSSDDGGRHYCPTNVQGRVQLVKQRSDSPCQEGYGWGSDRRGIWVDHGCRADFAVTPYPDGGSDQGSVISCSSDDGGRHYCPADTHGGVQLVKQRSDSSCEQDRSWGFDRRGIWVDHGCRADFQVGR